MSSNDQYTEFTVSLVWLNSFSNEVSGNQE